MEMQCFEWVSNRVNKESTTVNQDMLERNDWYLPQTNSVPPFCDALIIAAHEVLSAMEQRKNMGDTVLYHGNEVVQIPRPPTAPQMKSILLGRGLASPRATLFLLWTTTLGADTEDRRQATCVAANGGEPQGHKG